MTLEPVRVMGAGVVLISCAGEVDIQYTYIISFEIL